MAERVVVEDLAAERVPVRTADRHIGSNPRPLACYSKRMPGLSFERTPGIALSMLAALGVELSLGCGARCPGAMVNIPAGTFEMGTTFDVEYSEEKVVHKVTLSAFCMDRTEVTVDAYVKCVEDGRCKIGGGNGLYACSRLPEHSGRAMNCLTWNQANEFCKQRGARLPTEAEWAYAARGTDGRLYPWGDVPPDPSRYWGGSNESSCPGCPTKVGSFPKRNRSRPRLRGEAADATQLA